MKKTWLRFNCKLHEVKETFFTAKGSPFYYVPKNKKLLLVLSNYPSGVPISIYGYKMSPESHFVSVGKIVIDKYRNSAKARTRFIVAHAECERLTAERQATKRHINSGGFSSGLLAKGPNSGRKRTYGRKKKLKDLPELPS